MFLRKTQRKKDGKTHDYWSVVENKRVAGGRMVQRHVLYLGEINSSQAAAWRHAIEVLDDAGHARTLALFPEDRCTAIASETSVVQLRLSDMRLCRPRQWGACWLAGQLWRELQLDDFWADRLPTSRKGTRWDQVLQVLVSYRLIAPGSEWKLHREWFGKSAMADLLGADFGLAEAHKLYACHDFLLRHKDALFSHLVARWRDLFNANFDVLLYDLTSTYFEINASDTPEGDKRRHGYSRDKRPDCPQVVIALVVTPDGLPLAYEVLPGNTADCKTLRMFLDKIEQQYGRARRVWVMRPPGQAARGRHPDRSGTGGNAGQRSASAVSGGNAEGTPVASGETAPGAALAAGPRGRLGQAAGRGWRTLCRSLSSGGPLARPVSRECRARQQGTRDAQTAIEMAVETAARVGREGDLARGNADEARRGKGPRSHRMAPRRSLLCVNLDKDRMEHHTAGSATGRGAGQGPAPGKRRNS